MRARLGSALLMLVLGLSSATAKEAKPSLAWRPTYADALLEARLRNVPVLVSRHKDG